MDISQLKKSADLSYDTAVAKRNALERAESRQLIAQDGHLFRADAHTICLVRTLMEGRDSFYMLDANNNPVEVKDPNNFLTRLIERNQESLNSYHQTYIDFSKKV
jgi:hypothetical protein